ncbi:BON domain-containing protein [Hahella sp. KA22]|uniref:Predicted periplasmic or secreted lipoprotein n=1 Tax=Hahella chejuensis (strain KCTC 2396) TaxID=349521 RepID=Q2SGX0_HAHCH|nr:MULTISPECIES: BON domain-containing protein [Hahella]ABC30104.1 predicted periplasmic or secreted lipoprotein [Hahella chejuensis KCTC 2396]AZZ94864.1 BON domain-containing protein [Hahella sp. KA22]QAY58237.1 BON domain-containing protein [Hahella sp. KA22]
MDKNKVEAEDASPTAAANSESSTKEANSFIKDSWITMKVKSSLFLDKKSPGLSVGVCTKDSVVTLTGHLHSAGEQIAAVKAAKSVRGVKKVETKGLTFDPDVVMRH